MIEFGQKLDEHDVFCGCKNIIVMKLPADLTGAPGATSNYYPKIICENCHYCIFINNDTRAISWIQTLVDGIAVYIAKTGTTFSGNDSNRLLYLDYPLVKSPIDLKTFAATVKKRMLLI